jgi:hypothetical protein
MAPGAVPAVAVPAMATLVHPAELAGGGPHMRQNSSEQVSPEPHRSPDAQHFSASWPHMPGVPPVPVLSVALLALVTFVLPHPKRCPEARATSASNFVEFEIMAF